MLHVKIDLVSFGKQMSVKTEALTALKEVRK